MKYLSFFIVLSLAVIWGCGDPVEIDCSDCKESITGYEIVVVESTYDNAPSKQLVANCPAGKKVLSAGWSVLDGTDAILSGRATYSEPSFDGQSWMVNAINTDTSFSPEWKLRIRCVCADVE
ncbi:hypothetical protein [Ulvibacter antarcticus]|uniref:Uncharacterized protein n=1 Tax=Ulvibacter antarcticus TaxID=442714 RepID=A0A3L9YW97_9FLAO|nr:hypothetical protein [Ulvibacter antarcticus]RMA64793.1 hypothetical protein BXY75_1674 [Ulvibacter antarcticus]